MRQRAGMVLCSVMRRACRVGVNAELPDGHRGGLTAKARRARWRFPFLLDRRTEEGRFGRMVETDSTGK
jgi:hypothetical protein